MIYSFILGLLKLLRCLKARGIFDSAGLGHTMVLFGWIFAGSFTDTTGTLMLGTDWLAGGASVSVGWWFGIDWFSFDCCYCILQWL